MTEPVENIAYLGLGSNMGDRLAHLQSGVAALERLPDTHVLRQSSVYVSKAWGKTDQADFLNMVVEIGTYLDPTSLLVYCKDIERAEGRGPGERWGPRPLDIDILLFDDVVLVTQRLTIPHPRMWERRFVLRPLADLRPDLIAPDGVPITSLLEREDIASQAVWPYELESKMDEG